MSVQEKTISGELYSRYPELKICQNEIESAIIMLENAFRQKGKLLLCGNGGSSADCDHIVGELMKGFLKKREGSKNLAFQNTGERNLFAQIQGALPAISLPAQSALISAYCNDVAPELVYAQMVYGYGQGEDVLLGISTSGNSANIVNAVRMARTCGIKTIGLTGKTGGILKELCDLTICVPETETYRIQELHLPVYHYICAEIEKRFWD